jgi:predicted deacylase
VEVGNPQRFKTEFIRTTLRGVRRILAEVGMVARRPAPESAAPILCTHSRWLHSDHGGLLEVFPAVTDFLEEGQVIARVSNVFGDVVREYRASEPGVVIGKSVNPVAQTGARILHLGTPAPLGTYPVPEPLPGRREPKQEKQ